MRRPILLGPILIALASGGFLAESALAVGAEMVPMPPSNAAPSAGPSLPNSLPVVQSPGGAPAQIAPLGHGTPAGVHFTATDHGGFAVLLGDGPAPVAIPHRHGVQLRFAGKPDLDLTGLRQIPGVISATSWPDHGATVVEVRTRAGQLDGQSEEGKLVLTNAHSLAKRSETPATPRGPDAAELDALRQSVASKLAALNNVPMPTDPANGPKADSQAADSQTPSSPASGSQTPGVAVSTGPADAPSAVIPAAALAPKPLLHGLCPPIDFAAWKGNADFAIVAARLRGKLARNPDDLRAAAALAQFYVVHGMAAEALVLAADWSDDDPTTPGRDALMQARDIALLMQRTPTASAAALLQPSTSCERTDLGLWQALQAAAHGDTATVNADARHARMALGDVPEPLRTMLAVNIADASNENAETLRAMVSATRNAAGGPPEDTTSRWLLQARVAQAENNTNDEQLFLERAAQDQNSVPGLFARVRLAGLQLRRPGEDASRAQKLLQDVARTYRHDALGEEAALVLAKHRLSENDFANALQLADAATAASRQGSSSRGARLAADLLRQMLVDPQGATLPPPAQRITLFWHYEGYATPGESGDDIRIGAARLLLQQGFPDAAVDITRQLAPASMQTAAAIDTRARAEAIAASGDPHNALALLTNQAPSPDRSRIAARALSRLGQTADAARALAGLPDLQDRTRRAELFYTANLWPDAASAYADVLRDPGIDKEQRAEATRRYALAVSLSHTPPANAPPAALLAPDDLSGRLLTAASPPAPEPLNAPPVTSVREAIDRSRQIETLLNP